MTIMTAKPWLCQFGAARALLCCVLALLLLDQTQSSVSFALQNLFALEGMAAASDDDESETVKVAATAAAPRSARRRIRPTVPSEARRQPFRPAAALTRATAVPVYPAGSNPACGTRLRC